MNNQTIDLINLNNFKTCKHRNMFEQLKLFNNILDVLAGADRPLSEKEIARLITEPRKRYAKAEYGGYTTYKFHQFGKPTNESYDSNCNWVIEDDVTEMIVRTNIKRLVEINLVEVIVSYAIDKDYFEEIFGKNTGVVIPRIKKYYLNK